MTTLDAREPEDPRLWSSLHLPRMGSTRGTQYQTRASRTPGRRRAPRRAGVVVEDLEGLVWVVRSAGSVVVEERGVRLRAGRTRGAQAGPHRVWAPRTATAQHPWESDAWARRAVVAATAGLAVPEECGTMRAPTGCPGRFSVVRTLLGGPISGVSQACRLGKRFWRWGPPALLRCGSLDGAPHPTTGDASGGEPFGQ
jgi:hypothetical protein